MNARDELIEELSFTSEWHPLFLAAHNAFVSMGTFQHPLDDMLMGMTFGEWQLETARRIVLAILKEEERQIDEIQA